MSLLGIGSILLGAKTLEEFGLALLIGLISGAYSSIFIASPLLAIMKEREPRNRDIRRRIETRTIARQAAEREAVATDSTPADGEELREPVPVSAAAGASGRPSGRVAPNIPPRPRKKGKRR
jgi:preprotein translocase subunit SecF